MVSLITRPPLVIQQQVIRTATCAAYTMPAMIRLTVLTASLLTVAQVSFGQEAPNHSFQQLTVKPQQRIHVQPTDGKTISWRVVSLTGDQLEVERRRWNFRIEKRIFTQGSVRRIKAHDSSLNGMLIGAGAGFLGGVLIGSICNDLGCLWPAVLSIGMGPSLGIAIDEFRERTIYTPTAGTTVTLSPLAGPNRFGVAAQIRLGVFH